MGDRAEVSHQTRTSDDHALGLGYRMGDSYTRLQTMSTGLGPMRLLRRAPHLRCGAARFCRWPTSGGGWEGRRAGRRRYGEGAVCVSAPLMVGAYGTGRRTPRGRGTCRRGRGRSTPSGTGILSPNAWAVPGWSGPHPAARNVPAGVGGTVVRGRRGSVQSAPVPPVPGGAVLGSPAGRRGTRAVPIPIKDP